MLRCPGYRRSGFSSMLSSQPPPPWNTLSVSVRRSAMVISKTYIKTTCSVRVTHCCIVFIKFSRWSSSRSSREHSLWTSNFGASWISLEIRKSAVMFLILWTCCLDMVRLASNIPVTLLATKIISGCDWGCAARVMEGGQDVMAPFHQPVTF